MDSDAQEPKVETLTTSYINLRSDYKLMQS